jgi:ABC-type polysaccharide/polyol phosphate transport system ATPase subunit
MSSDGIAVRVRDLSKHYHLFNRPEDRLKQMIVPRLDRLAGRKSRQYYRDFAALTGVSFDIKRGETVGIIGRNGSGKSTLLQIVCGTLLPSHGTVEVNGRIAALLELGAGFNPEFTGRENVYLNAAILGMTRTDIDARFDDIARFADIGAFVDQPVKTYSSGMYVRLAFATAINVDPDILIVDEALAVGDEAFQRKCFARIEQIKERGGTILFVSHAAPTIVQLCSRAILLDGGEVLLEGAPKTIVGQYHRLMNASFETAPAIRAAIAAMNGAPVAKHKPETSPPADSDLRGVPHPTAETFEAAEAATQVPSTRQKPAAQFDDLLDPALKPQSTIRYDERGARICDVRITTLSGTPVNLLQTGEDYLLRYRVEFETAATDVATGFGITTPSGFLLSTIAGSLSKAHQIPSVRPGETAEISFRFRCALLSGTYFVTTGCSGVVNYERCFLHRILDALMFRVAPEPHSFNLGHIDLQVEPSYELLTARQLSHTHRPK